MASPTCLVNTNSTINGVEVADGSTVTIQLQDTAGIKQWLIECISTDELNNKSIINTGLTIDFSTKTCIFDSPFMDGYGGAFIFKSTVNNQRDINNKIDIGLTTTFGIYIQCNTGRRVHAANETTESNAEFGWLPDINDLNRKYPTGSGLTAADAGDGLAFYNGQINVGTADGSITINPNSIQVGVINATQHGNLSGGLLHAVATTTTAGFMSAADKTSITNATSAATPNTLALRDGTAGCNFGPLTATNTVVNGTLDVSGTVALSGNSIGVLGTQAVNAAFTLSSANINDSRRMVFKTGDATTGASGNTTYTTGSTLTGSTGNATFLTGFSSTSGNTGNVLVRSGEALGLGTSGNLTLGTGDTNSSLSLAGNIFIIPGKTNGISNGNISFFSSSLNFGNGSGVIHLDSADISPNLPPNSGTIMYSQNGQFRLKSSDNSLLELGLQIKAYGTVGIGDFNIESEDINNSRPIVLKSGDGTSGISGYLSCSTGSSSSGPTGNAFLLSGPSTSSGETGLVLVRSGEALGTGSTGNSAIRSGATAGGAFTGRVSVESGDNAGTGISGDVVISTGTSGTGNTGTIRLFTGNAGGTAFSGNIEISTGSGGGVSRDGNISLGQLNPNYRSGHRVIFIRNCQASPTSSPTGSEGVFIFAANGRLFVRDVGGFSRQL